MTTGTDWTFLDPLQNQDLTAPNPNNGNNPFLSVTNQNFWTNLWSGSTTCNFTTRIGLSNAMGPASGPHGAVHVAASLNGPNGIPDFHHATGSTWFYIWHAFVDDAWNKWECTCNFPPNWPQIVGPDVCMRDRDSDLGIPMINSLDVGYEPFNVTANTPLWVSEDIWVRNVDDGIYNSGINFSTTNPGMQEHQDPEYNIAGIPNWVYVRVRNRGCTASAATGNELKVYWAKATTALSWDDHWDNTLTCSGSGASMGNIIPSSPLTIPSIPPGGHIIMKFPWVVPDPQQYTNCALSWNNAEFWHFCLLARIETSPVAPFGMATAETTILYDNVKNNNNIVWRNLSVVDLAPGIAQEEPCSNKMLAGAIVGVGNPGTTTENFDINFQLPESNNEVPVTDEAEVNIFLDPLTWTKWANGGFQSQNVVIKSVPCRYITVTGNPARINNLQFDAYERGTIYVSFNMLSAEVTPTREFYYDVVQTRTSDGATIGGEQYRIVKHDRVRFFADAGNDQIITLNETTTLTAVDIGEDAIYNWYNSAGTLIGSGQTIQVSPQTTTEYKLEVIARSDGYTAYDYITITVTPYEIISLVPNPASDNVNIGYNASGASSAYLQLMMPYGYTSPPYVLNTELNEIAINLSEYTSGLYFVILVCDEQQVDVKLLSVEVE